MVINESDSLVPVKQAGIKKRSFFCWILLSISLTYFVILALLFLAGAVYSGKIIVMIAPYYSSGEDLPRLFNGFALSGALLYFLSSAGIILFMLKRKAGFYIFFLSTLIIFSLDLAFLSFDWMRYLIHTGFIFILGIAHFSKRCYY
jgi:hypothetical protein